MNQLYIVILLVVKNICPMEAPSLDNIPLEVKYKIIKNITRFKNYKDSFKALNALFKINKSYLQLSQDIKLNETILNFLCQHHSAPLSLLCPQDITFGAAYYLNTSGIRDWIRNIYLTQVKNFKFVSYSFFARMQQLRKRKSYVVRFIEQTFPSTPKVPLIIKQRLSSIFTHNSVVLSSFMNILADSKSQINQSNDDLAYSIKNPRHKKDIQVFLNQGADPNFEDPIDGCPLLLTTLKTNNISDALLLLSADANPNCHDLERVCPLDRIICQYDDVLILEKFLKSEATINTYFYDGITPLLRALNTTKTNFVTTLLEKGANPNLKGICNEFPLMVAYEKNNIENFNQLLAYGANPNEQLPRITNIFLLAVSKNNIEFVKPMLEAGANLQSRNSLNLTAVEIAQKNNFDQMDELLSLYKNKRENAQRPRKK